MNKNRECMGAAPINLLDYFCGKRQTLTHLDVAVLQLSFFGLSLLIGGTY